LAAIEERAAKYDHARALVNGIHRFLFEEQADVQPGRSRTQLRQACRPLAYQVVQRSDAWGRLLADCFPTALRLSIHPQHPHAEKIGILLGPADDVWLTPWHGVAVQQAGGWRLMKRCDAEAAGARLVEADGRPSHFVLP
jgi:pyoverdine/dityrosine biosynthesis protein Dit1